MRPSILKPPSKRILNISVKILHTFVSGSSKSTYRKSKKVTPANRNRVPEMRTGGVMRTAEIGLLIINPIQKPLLTNATMRPEDAYTVK